MDSRQHDKLGTERKKGRERARARAREQRELTLGPVGPPRHMGVAVVRHSTQHGLPASAAGGGAGAIPIT